MKTIKLQGSVSSDGSLLILKSVGTVWEDINVSSLSINVYTESKTTPVSTYILTPSEVESLRSDTDGLQAALDSVIPDNKTSDNFYIITLSGVDVDTTAINSEYVCLGLTYNIERIFRNESLDKSFSQLYRKDNLSPSDLMLSISHVNGHLMLDHLYKVSTIATYTYDREITWRKLNQVLNTYYGN